MFQEKIFNHDILSSIVHNYTYFFTFLDMYVYAGYVLGILLLLGLPLIFCGTNEYLPFFSNEQKIFNYRKKSDWIGLSALLLSITAFFIIMIMQENSLFCNFDSMTIDYIDSLKQGIKPVFGEWRFTPMSGIDYNFAFAVTNNYFMINCYVALKQLFCLWLLYKLFCFMPVDKRLFMLAVINFIPACFWMNNFIFQEQNILIFVVLSLMSLNKYQQNSKSRYLFYFLITMNLAMYTKENVILFYAGLGAWLILTAVVNEKITLNSFFHPLKTIKTLPVEWIMFWSFFVYSTCWFLSTPIDENRYLTTHSRNLAEVCNIYKCELALNAIALIVMLVKVFRKQFKNMNLLGEGSVFGSSLVTFFIVFKSHIVPASDYILSYYLYLTAVFCTAYIFCNLSRKWLLGTFAIVVIAYSGWENYNIHLAQKGVYRRELAEFIISKAKDEDMVIYMHSNQRLDYKWWKTMGWSASLKYAAPDARLHLKTDLDIYSFYHAEDSKFFRMLLGKPEKGDYILVNVTERPAFVPAPEYETVYQNKVYRLYYIGG